MLYDLPNLISVLICLTLFYHLYILLAHSKIFTYFTSKKYTIILKAHPIICWHKGNSRVYDRKKLYRFRKYV